MTEIIDSWLIIEFLSSGNEIDKRTNFQFNQDNYNKFLNEQKHEGIKILLATFDRANGYDLLAKIFKDKSFVQRPSGTSYGCEFEINLEGEIDKDSISISTFPWAIMNLEKKTKLNNWFDDFQKFKFDIIDEIVEIFAPHDKRSIFEKTREVEKLFFIRYNLNDFFLNSTFFQPFEKKSDSEKNNLINSFYSEDLSRLIQQKNNFGSALKQYLSINPITSKIDLIKNPEKIIELTNSSKIPEGSWPSANSLSLMQQVAVNYLSNELSYKTGVFSVNGPPGTGKTTLLKDVFASIIVKRAKCLIEFNNPSDAFQDSGKVIPLSATFRAKYFIPHQRIIDDAIVVASSNNTAVENLSKELPKIDRACIDKFDGYPNNGYFKEIAEKVLETEDVWNCLSLALGNNKNKSAFINLWFGKLNSETNEKEGFQESINKLNYTKNDWLQVRDEFQNLLNNFNKKKEELSKNEIIMNDSNLKILLVESDFDEDKCLKCQFDLKSYHLKIKLECQLKIADLEKRIAIIKELKPAFWHFWFNTKQVKRYRNKIVENLKEIDKENEIILQTNFEKEKVKNNILLIKKFFKIKKSYEKWTPDENFWSSAFKENPSTAQELSPWYNKELKKLTSELFLKAIEVQTVFISLASKEIKNNINILVALLKNSIKLDSDESRNVWNTLFLLVPIISTTFASVSNLFKGVEKEAFGWLFIDEAGQAVPQAAAGAIYRSKRVVAVGDPLQIEPVISLPERIFDYIRSEKQISPELMSSFESVQTFADRTNHLGTTIQESLWIGSPLKVHRRCNEPMFRIANRIAYDDIMQNANRNEEISKYNKVYSRFENIEGNVSIKQFVPNQGLKAIEVIKEYNEYILNNKKEKFSLFVISPFKAVINNFKQQVAEHLSPDIKEKLKGNIGTVHTFQGKEANVVLFLIGCDESTKEALNWADSKPNLLNVALTRAKQIFIAFGDKTMCKRTKYFSIMIDELDIVEKQLTD